MCNRVYVTTLWYTVSTVLSTSVSGYLVISNRPINVLLNYIFSLLSLLSKSFILCVNVPTHQKISSFCVIFFLVKYPRFCGYRYEVFHCNFFSLCQSTFFKSTNLQNSSLPKNPTQAVI